LYFFLWYLVEDFVYAMVPVKEEEEEPFPQMEE
jgi:hypothetical protein